MNLKKIVLSVMITIVIVFLCFCVLPWGLVALGSLFTSTPLTPKITCGEFPFELVYEYDDETVSVEDTLVIEYKGVEWNEGSGKYTTWESTFLNSVEGYHKYFYEVLLKKVDNEEDGDYEICFYLGIPEYYMGLGKTGSLYKIYNIYPGDFFIRTQYEPYIAPLDEETLYEEYDIKIIKKSISEPLSDNVK